MTILVDDTVDGWCHLWDSDGDGEALDAFALSIGLKLSWCHISTSAFVGEFYHFDLKPSKRALALKRGAQYMPLKDWIHQQRAKEYGNKHHNAYASHNYQRHIQGLPLLCSCGERWECPTGWNCPENQALNEKEDEDAEPNEE